MSTSLGNTAAMPHRRNNFWVALAGPSLYRLSVAQGWARRIMRVIGGPEMAQADGCVTLPQFVEKTDRAGGVAVFAAAIILVLAGALPAASAEYRGTQDQQQACTPDVMRLCSDSLPDVDRIVGCLRRNRSNLSPACGSVFGAGLSHRPRHHQKS